ncbi:MAG TPA: nuclear transport factor 2 family protein [Steroidobacteraceae bacterium]
MQSNHSEQSAKETEEVMHRFHDAFDRHDSAAFIELVADDCIIENTTPAPNGSLHVGKEACLAVWQGLAAARDTSFSREEEWFVGERAIVRWRYKWGADESQSVRGVNLMRVRNGRVAEAMGYVKSSPAPEGRR